MCISFDNSWFATTGARVCSNTPMVGSDFCELHFSLTRPAYKQYKHATAIVLLVHQTIYADRHKSTVQDYLRFYDQINNAIQKRIKFMNKFVHETCRDANHIEFIDNLKEIRDLCVAKLTALFNEATFFDTNQALKQEDEEEKKEFDNNNNNNNSNSFNIILEPQHKEQKKQITIEQFLLQSIKQSQNERQKIKVVIDQIGVILSKLLETFTTKAIVHLAQYLKKRTQANLIFTSSFVKEILSIGIGGQLNVFMHTLYYIAKQQQKGYKRYDKNTFDLINDVACSLTRGTDIFGKVAFLRFLNRPITTVGFYDEYDVIMQKYDTITTSLLSFFTDSCISLTSAQQLFEVARSQECENFVLGECMKSLDHKPTQYLYNQILGRLRLRCCQTISV